MRGHLVSKVCQVCIPQALQKSWQHMSVSVEIKVCEDTQADLLTPRVRAEQVRGLCGKDEMFYHLQCTCFMDKQRNSKAVSLMPQQKQFVLCHFLLKNRSVRCLLYCGKIQQPKFSSQVQQEEKESQK